MMDFQIPEISDADNLCQTQFSKCFVPEPSCITCPCSECHAQGYTSAALFLLIGQRMPLKLLEYRARDRIIAWAI